VYKERTKTGHNVKTQSEHPISFSRFHVVSVERTT